MTVIKMLIAGVYDSSCSSNVMAMGDDHLLETFRTRMKASIKMSTPTQQSKQCRVAKTNDMMNFIVRAFSARDHATNPTFLRPSHLLHALFLAASPCCSTHLLSRARCSFLDLTFSKPCTTLAFSIRIFFSNLRTFT